MISDEPVAEATHPLAAHHPIGMSTGVFAAARGYWPQLVADACRVSPFAVELSALSGGELPGLISYLRAEPMLPFRYVSVHAPSKDLQPSEAAIATMLTELPVWIRSVVVHPDTMSDISRYLELGTRLVIENMDQRKPTGRVANELDSFFDEPARCGLLFWMLRTFAPSIQRWRWHTSYSTGSALDCDRWISSSLQDAHHVPLSTGGRGGVRGGSGSMQRRSVDSRSRSA